MTKHRVWRSISAGCATDCETLIEQRCPHDGTVLDWPDPDMGHCPKCGDEFAPSAESS
jgi:hypothetical protein